MHRNRQWCNLLLNDVAIVDVDVAYGIVLSLEQFNHRVEQLVQPLVVAGNGGYHWNTHHCTQVYIVNLCTLCQQLVIHIQRYNRAYVHIDEFSGEVQVALEVRCYNRVDDDVGHLLKEVTAHVNLLGRVCCYGVCSRQVGEVDAVALIVEAAGLGINGHTAVVAHVFVLVCQCIEDGCLATVGITHQCNIYYIPSLRGVPVVRGALSVAGCTAVAQRDAVVCGGWR